jgi:hypothetical protein
MVGQKEGMNPLGMYRHTHPDVPRGATASISWNPEGMVDPYTRRILADKYPAMLKSGMAGIAADEVFSGKPRTENPNFTRIDIPYSDGGKVFRMLREMGMTPPEAMIEMGRLIDEQKEYLTNPHVSAIIKENIGKREPGLSRQYHYSPDRLKQMHLEAQRRIQNEGINDRGVAGQGSQGPPGNVTGAEGRSPEAVRAAEVPENPKLGGLREQSTGDPEADKAIRDAGAVPAGRMFPGEPYELKAFHDPKTGSTLNIKATEPITAEAIRQRLADSRAKFAAGIDELKK